MYYKNWNIIGAFTHSDCMIIKKTFAAAFVLNILKIQVFAAACKELDLLERKSGKFD